MKSYYALIKLISATDKFPRRAGSGTNSPEKLNSFNVTISKTTVWIKICKYLR